jgi:hypothetical protein
MVLPPLEERDGTLARAAASDGSDWIPVKSADGHPHWFPPEWEHLAYGMDMSWSAVQTRHQVALLLRAEHRHPAERPPVEHSARPTTMAGACALAAFLVEGSDWDERISGPDLVQRAAEFADTHGLDGHELVKVESRVLQDMARGMLRAIRKARGRD